MYNVSREKITTHISNSWRKAAWFVQQERKNLSRATRSSIAIAEWDSTWSPITDEDYEFRVKFGAPKVQLLCEHEAVLYVQVDEVVFSENKTFSSTYVFLLNPDSKD